ncbi:MAG: substrate-binding domain-containing protein [Verrucomicrobiota bacterium]
MEKEIRNGIWQGELPGKRTLAERFRVNVKTCTGAMVLLEQRGFVGPASAGKGRQILATSKGKKKVSYARGMRLLILHPTTGVLSTEDFKLLQGMVGVWERNHGEAIWAQVDYTRCKDPGPVLDALIARHAVDAFLFFVPQITWGRLAGMRRPYYQVGGPFHADDPISLGAFAIDIEVKRVVRYLREKGHRRILLPSEMHERMRQSIVKGLSEGNDSKPEFGRWEDYCPLFPESVPGVWASYWKKSFATVRPTAVVLFEDTHLLSLYGYCYMEGLQIPKDLSVVSIGYEPRFEWCSPRPTMMRYPVKSAVAHFQQWLEGGLKPIGRKYFPLEMVEGDSVAPPAAGGR